MDAFDYYVLKIMHELFPFANVQLGGFPIGDFLLFTLLAYTVSEIYLITKGVKSKK